MTLQELALSLAAAENDAADAPVFVTPYRCAKCGRNTDTAPCHRCGAVPDPHTTPEKD